MMKLTLENVLVKWALRVGCLCIAASLAVSLACASQGQGARSQSKQSESSLGPASGTVAAPPGDDYVIGPGDILAINVWKQAELSGRVSVRLDGKISMLLIGEVEAAGLTPPGLADLITEKLKTYVTKPQVNVLVEEVKSKFVNIVGEVTKPGRYELVQPMTILDAILNAGGPTQYAKLKKIYVLRALGGGAQQTLPFDYKAVIKGRKLEENVYLKRGDILVIP
jgi:polysaccharide export outer membrane protein